MSPSATLARKSGMGMPTGQPVTQAGFLQWTQRLASFTASSRV